MTTNSGSPLMIQRKKGKMEVFTLNKPKTPIKSMPLNSSMVRKNATPNKNMSLKGVTTITGSSSPKAIVSPRVNVVIPKLTKKPGGPGPAVVRKAVLDNRNNEKSTTNGPKSSNESKNDALVNYSDSSNDGKDQDPLDTGLDMEVDEDGAPKMASEARLFANANKKRAVESVENADDENSVDKAKKAKLEEDQKTTDAS